MRPSLPICCSLICAVTWAPLRLEAASSDLRAKDQPFTSYLTTAIPPVKGFDPPLGIQAGDVQALGRYDLNHPYLDCSQVLTPIGPVARGLDSIPCRQVRAVAAGRVLRSTARGTGVTVIEHLLYDNHRRRHLLSRYGALAQSLVKAGDQVRRGQVIGLAPARNPLGPYPTFDFELCDGPGEFGQQNLDEGSGACAGSDIEDPLSYVLAHRASFVPTLENSLVLVDKASAQLRLYRRGRLILATDLAFGQQSGRKRKRGDLKTPSGMYFVTNKSRGPFAGKYGEYYGGHWIKINYPNRYDAAFGQRRGYISMAQRRRIDREWTARTTTLQKTKLGSGIGFHGWAGQWDGSQGRNLSWGCMVLHAEDIATLYQHLQPGSMVVIF